MKRKLPLILTIIFAIGSIIVAFDLYNKVIKEKELQDEIITEEEAIKQKLLFYSEIQKLHYLEKDSYIGDWKSFYNYILKGKIHLVQRSETQKELYFGKDTTIITYDTIKTISIKDSIQKKTDYELKTIGYVPKKSREFEIYTGYVKGRAVFEIRDSRPINPRRRSGELDTLMIGSKYEPTTEGNWH